MCHQTEPFRNVLVALGIAFKQSKRTRLPIQEFLTRLKVSFCRNHRRRCCSQRCVIATLLFIALY